METAYVVTFITMFTLLFFMVGGIIGWLTYRHLLESRPKTFQVKFGKMISLFRREFHFFIEFHFDVRKK